MDESLTEESAAEILDQAVSKALGLLDESKKIFEIADAIMIHNCLVNEAYRPIHTFKSCVASLEGDLKLGCSRKRVFDNRVKKLNDAWGTMKEMACLKIRIAVMLRYNFEVFRLSDLRSFRQKFGQIINFSSSSFTGSNL